MALLLLLLLPANDNDEMSSAVVTEHLIFLCLLSYLYGVFFLAKHQLNVLSHLVDHRVSVHLTHSRVH